ncbi:MAG: ATP-dependent DNA helicase RecG [Alphaproteobacteria bacterium]
MRPTILNPLFADVTTLDAVGPKIAGLLGRLLTNSATAPRVIDLLFHLPVAVIDRSRRCLITEASAGAIATVKVRVDRHQPNPSGRSRLPYRVFVHDDSGELALVYFHANRSWLERTLPPGRTVYVSGEVEWFNGRPQIVHPDYVVAEADEGELPLFEPIYPLTAGLSRKTVLKAVANAIDSMPVLPEWIPEQRVLAGDWPTFGKALERLHQLRSIGDLEPANPARVRLAYDELLADQLALALTRAHMRRSPGKTRSASGEVAGRLVAALPFELTVDQQRAIIEINEDLSVPQRMLRLLQGDVGSGKTVVALLAMATVIEAGSQAALMAPTEILARQHEATIRPIAESAGLRVAILTGRESKPDRARVLADLNVPAADGADDLLGDRRGIDILIGTHALFQESVQFHDLGLAVIDEQHRFGVQQRLALAAKGDTTDVLVMTATPIPRSLVLTSFGDMDVSQLREKPAGRKPIDTRAVSTERLDEVVTRLKVALDSGGRAFWVCPLVEESEESNLTSAEARAKALDKVLGHPVGIVHGRMAAVEKDAAMDRFRSGATPVLVATTVIEVGVDVPDASIMVIEHAERFGLAQLHQLRGRVGRGTKSSTCLLLYKPPLGDTARARLNILRESDDGFLIAEEDLRLRGGGELLGTRQSGLPGFRLADLDHHRSVLEAAQRDARDIVTTNGGLKGGDGEAIRALLYLFGRDAAIRLLRAG